MFGGHILNGHPKSAGLLVGKIRNKPWCCYMVECFFLAKEQHFLTTTLYVFQAHSPIQSVGKFSAQHEALHHRWSTDLSPGIETSISLSQTTLLESTVYVYLGTEFGELGRVFGPFFPFPDFHWMYYVVQFLKWICRDLPLKFNPCWRIFMEIFWLPKEVALSCMDKFLVERP